MNPEENQGADITPKEDVKVETGSDEVVSLSKSEYEKMNQTLGSLKRELKDLKKPKEEHVETTSNSKDSNVLLQKLEKMALRQAGVSHEDDIALAQRTAKKWGVDIDEVLSDEDFKIKLEKQQSERLNTEATSNIRGGSANSQAKNTPEYWIAKGTPPTPSDVPDRKTRATIIKSLMASSKNGKKFYNE